MKTDRDQWNAEDYANHSSAQEQWARELIALLSLTGTERLLDIGCGDGKITAQLARMLPQGHACGIDLSPDMIRCASGLYPTVTYPNLSFRQMDAADIHLSERFDVAFSNAALHWVENHRAVLHGVRTCLGPNGRLLFQMGGRGNAADIFTALAEVLENPAWRNYFESFIPPYHFYGPEEYQTWLQESGFDVIRAELIEKDMQHPGKEGLKGWLRTTWFPYTDRVPPKRRDDFLEAILDSFLTRHPVDSAGCTHVKMIRLEIEAVAG